MKFKKILFIAITLVTTLSLFTSCKEKHIADYILCNATIYTVDSAFSVVDALAVKEGKIVAIGTLDEIEKQWIPVEYYNANKKFVYPGFIDAHCHFVGYGTNKIRNVDLKGTTSFEECITRLQLYDKQFHPEWIIGRGWDQNDWENKSLPVNTLLNEAFPDQPVYLVRIDGHAAIANQKALVLSGVNPTTKVEGGALITQNGKLTGVLVDNAEELVAQHIPPVTQKELREAVLTAQKDCFSYGLTSVVDCGLEVEVIQLLQTMYEEHQLSMRINAMLSPEKETLDYFIKNGKIESDLLNVGCIKLYADGALGSRGALLFEPYSDDITTCGLQVESLQFYDSIAQLAKRYDFQLATHCIGDAANRFMLECYSRQLEDGNDRRWRIEHAQVMHPNDFELFAKKNIIPSVQPTHATSDMYWAEERVGKERIQTAYAYQTLLHTNGWLPLGTDFPIEKVNPLLTFYAAISRQDVHGFPPEGFLPEERLSRVEALRGMTIWAAKGSFEENKKGSLEVGKFADFVVLDKDIMTIEMSEIPEVNVVGTVLGGRKVYYSNR